MPLPRYQIRNEYSLADPELYRAADKDDPEALLEGVAMAGLVGVLRQLGDLAEFAAEIFHDLHEEVMATSARGHGLMVRVQQLEAEFPSIEKAFLSQTSHSSFFYNTGVDWHPNLRMDQSLITQGDLPRFVMDSYEECRGPPQLFLLDKFDVAGAGACLKRYTDPSFFKVDSSSSGMTNAKVQREKKIRKAKKKGSHWRNGGTPEVLTTSNAKLHQLFLEESVENHINDSARRVKLKRRLNGFPFGSKTGKSYMEQFLKSPTPDSNVREISVNLSPLKLPSNITGESGIEVLEISTVSPDKELAHPCSSPDVEETGRKPTIVELCEEVKYGISEVPGLNPISEADNVLSTLHEDVDEKEIAVDGGRKIEGSVDGYQSDDIASEVDNYMDALTTMDSEMETDTECKAKNDLHFLNVENQGIDSDANEEQRDIQAHFSDSQSIGNSTATDDGNSSSKKGLFSFSFSDSLSNSTENMPSDGDVSAKALQSTEICEFEIVNMTSDRHTVNEESPLTQAPKHMVCDGVCNEEANIPSYRPEFAEPSSISCHADSTPMLVPVDPVKSLMACSSVEPELNEISSNNELNTKCSNLEENTAYLGENLPCTSNLSDSPSQTRYDFPPELSSENHHVDEFDDEDPHTLSHASQQLSNILEPAAHGKNSNESLLDDSLQAEYAEDECPEISVDIQIVSPHSVASHAEEQHLDSAFPELETCHPDMKPDGIVSKVDDAPPMPEEKAISSTPTVDNLEATSFTKQQFSGISENISPHELDSAEVGFSYSREKKLDVASNAADCEESGGFSTDMDIIGKDDSSLKFSPDFQSSPDPPPVPDVHLDDVVTETVHSEVVIVATAVVGSHCDDNEDDSKSFSTSPTKLQEESITILEDLHQNGMEINKASSPEHLQESCTEKEVDQQAVASSNLDSVLCNTVSCDDSNSEFLSSVIDSSTVATSRNSLHIAGATTVPLSSDQHDQDSESKSAQKINAIEIAEDTVSSPTHHNAELKMHIADATTVPLSSDQHDQDSESKSAQKINAIEIAEDTVSSPTHHNAELKMHIADATTVPLSSDQHDQDSESKSAQKINAIEIAEDTVSSPINHNAEPSTPLEQKVDLQDDQFDVESWGEQDSESKSALQINVIEKAEDAASSPTHHIAELTTPLEQKIDLQDDQFDVEYWHSDKASSEPFSLVDQIQSPNYLDQEKYTDASSEFCAAQPPVSQFLPQRDVSEQAKDPSSSMFSSPGLLPEVSQINLDEMPPLPPLPPMQWRLGKVQNASLASERDFVGHNPDSFPPILPSTADAKTQLGHPAIEGEIIQPLNPFLPISTLKDENSQHGYNNLVGYMVHYDTSSLQVPTMVNHRNSEDDFSSSIRTQTTNPFLKLPTIYSESSEHGFLTSEGETAQPSVNPFSPVTNVEDTVFTYPSGSLPEKLVQPLHQSAPETSLEDEKLRSTSVISDGKPVVQDDQPQHVFSTSEGQTDWSMGTSVPLPPFEDGKPNGNRSMKLPRPPKPLIDAVAAHDKSKMKKVTERVRPQIGQKADERDSLLEQIRTKSFNLKPATLARPSIQGPSTNLKVAAILEKANAIRQAFAGSDDEDDDEDSWSDS
ncbi:hypothetical protein ACSBR2_003403 [Camellia fascicularis]